MDCYRGKVKPVYEKEPTFKDFSRNKLLWQPQPDQDQAQVQQLGAEQDGQGPDELQIWPVHSFGGKISEDSRYKKVRSHTFPETKWYFWASKWKVSPETQSCTKNTCASSFYTHLPQEQQEIEMILYCFYSLN